MTAMEVLGNYAIPAMKLDSIKLTEQMNRRIRLTQAQKEMVRERYKRGGVSQRELAKEYGVSRRTIIFAIYPERYEASKERRRRAWADGKYRGYYDRKKHTKAMRDIRKRKRTIKNNELQLT